MTDRERQESEEQAADIARAIMLSNADKHDWPKTVVLRLLKNSDEVSNALKTAESLGQIRRDVHRAGQDLTPGWANGAWILVPNIHAEVVLDPSYSLQPFNIVIHEHELEKLKSALRTVPKTMRPKYRAVPQGESCGVNESDSCSGSSIDECNPAQIEYEVVRTFIHVPEADSSEISARVAKSAPF
jgi:hypothetical protein